MKVFVNMFHPTTGSGTQQIASFGFFSKKTESAIGGVTWCNWEIKWLEKCQFDLRFTIGENCLSHLGLLPRIILIFFDRMMYEESDNG